MSQDAIEALFDQMESEEGHSTDTTGCADCRWCVCGVCECFDQLLEPWELHFPARCKEFDSRYW